jgi:phage tail sheath protein FI
VFTDGGSTLPRTVAEVESAIPGLVGYTFKAMRSVADDLLNVPTRVASMVEFEALFGGPDTAAASEHLFHQAMRMFFDNGGKACYIVSAGGYNNPAGIDGSQLRAGVEALALVDEVTLLLVPEAVCCPPAAYQLLVQAMLRQCGERGDRFALLDVRDGDTALDTPPRDEASNREYFGTSDLRHGAAYYPFLRSAHEGASELPPSSAVAGAMVRSDSERGVWKAPANIGLSSVLGPVIDIDQQRSESLSVDAVSGKSINVIRAFPGKGTLLWGARTLAGNDNEWRYISVRRFCTMVEESILQSCSWVVFEPNDANTWGQVCAMIESYLLDKWRAGALLGNKPEAAFFVRCGLGTTMTQQDIAQGRIIIDIGLALVRPAEFIVLQFELKTAA